MYAQDNPPNKTDPSGNHGYSRNSPYERLVQEDYESFYTLEGFFEGEFELPYASKKGLVPNDPNNSDIPQLIGQPTWGTGRIDILHTLPNGKVGLAYEIEPEGSEWAGAAEINWYVQIYDRLSYYFSTRLGQTLVPRRIVHGTNYSWTKWRFVGYVNDEIVTAKLATAGVIIYRRTVDDKPIPIPVPARVPESKKSRERKPGWQPAPGGLIPLPGGASCNWWDNWLEPFSAPVTLPDLWQ